MFLRLVYTVICSICVLPPLAMTASVHAEEMGSVTSDGGDEPYTPAKKSKAQQAIDRVREKQMERSRAQQAMDRVRQRLISNGARQRMAQHAAASGRLRSSEGGRHRNRH